MISTLFYKNHTSAWSDEEAKGENDDDDDDDDGEGLSHTVAL